jgi:hypothetical protein
MRGQAAMEFLLSYGWAILIVLAAIGALNYFGIFNGEKFLPSKCVVNAPFSCSEHRALDLAQNNLRFWLVNAVEDLAEINMSVTCTDGSQAVMVSDPVTDFRVGQERVLNFTCPQQPKGEHMRGNIEIMYTTNAAISHTSLGEYQLPVEGE